MISTEKIIKRIESQIAVCKEIDSDWITITVNTGKRILELIREKQADADVEGGGTSWWYVCGGCHGAIDSRDKYCRHCGALIRWDTVPREAQPEE